MKNYRVVLARGYLVSIAAKDSEHAMRLAEFYVGDCADESTAIVRAERAFSIEKIDMTYNESLEAIEENSRYANKKQPAL